MQSNARLSKYNQLLCIFDNICPYNEVQIESTYDTKRMPQRHIQFEAK